MVAYTTNYGFAKWDINGVGWGAALNSTIDALDTQLYNLNSFAISKVGATMAGPLILSADPTDNLGAVTKQYADAITTALGVTNGNVATTLAVANAALPKAGGTLGAVTFSSTVLLSADPTLALQAATKQYVDTGTTIAIGATAGFYRNLKITVTGNASLTATADYINMLKTGGIGYGAALNVTLGTGSTGLNALDTGTVAASTWYNVWAVSNGTTTGAVLSLSAVAPNAAILASYPYYARIGAVRTNGSKLLLATMQCGRRAQYIVGGVNVPALPTMASGTAGNINTPTYVAVAVSSFVPPTAAAIDLLAYITLTNHVFAAPSASYGATGDSTNPSPVCCSDGLHTGRLMFLESSSVYWMSNGSDGAIYCGGWEDNL